MQRGRMWIVQRMHKAAYALQFFSLGIPTPKDLIELDRRHYLRESTFDVFTKVLVNEGLSPHEAEVLDRIIQNQGSAIVIGCGSGREAIALAKEGWSVVGIDHVSKFIDAAKRHAQQAGVQIDWVCQDVSEPFYLEKSCDLICLFGCVYSYIPTRRRRIQTLKNCKLHLKRGGLCVLKPVVNRLPPPSVRRLWAHRCRKLLAWLVRGNTECQVNDLWNGFQFVHPFSSPEELAQEAHEAGLVMEEIIEKPHWTVVLKNA